MSASESKKAVKRRKNKKASCGVTNNSSNEFAFPQDNVFRDQGLAEIDNLICSEDLPKSVISRGHNPFLGIEQCLLCHRKRSNPPSPEPNLEKGDGFEETSKLLCDTASLAQLPLWVCAECRHSVEEDSQNDCSDYPILAPDNLFLHSSPHDLTTCPVQDSPCTDSAIGSCETCTRKRLEEQENNQLQTDWIELHYGIWQIYRNVGIENEETEICAHVSESLSVEKFQGLVDRLCVSDAQQLFERLETQVHEAMINSKMHLLEVLPIAMTSILTKQHTIEAVTQFVQALLNDYSKLCKACAQVAPILKQLESETLKKFNLTWELVNRHLFQSIVYMDPLIQKNLPSFISHLRMASAQEGSSSQTDGPGFLYERYLKFNDEMNAISTVWQREAEHFIQEYNAEQLALKAKQKLLQDDWELFKMQRKLLEQQLQKDKIPITDDCSASFNDAMQQILSGNKSIVDDCHCPHCNKNQCPCDECSISHMFTCGLITPPETPIPDELLVASAPPLSSETAAQFLHSSLTNAMASAGKVLENTGCSNSVGHNCSQGHSCYHQHHLQTHAEFLLREVVDHHKDLNLVGMEELNVRWETMENEDDDDYDVDGNEDENDEDDDDDDDDEEEDEDDDEDDDDGEEDETEDQDLQSVKLTSALIDALAASTGNMYNKDEVNGQAVGTMSSSSSETVGSSSESVAQSCECHVCTAPPPTSTLPQNSAVIQDSVLDRTCECQQHSTSGASSTVNPQQLSLHLYPHIHGEISSANSHLLRPPVPIKPLIHPHLYTLHGSQHVHAPGKHRTITSSALTLLNSLELGTNNTQQYPNCAASVIQEQLYRTYGDCDSNIYENSKIYHNGVHKYPAPSNRRSLNSSDSTIEANNSAVTQQTNNVNFTPVTTCPISNKELFAPCTNTSASNINLDKASTHANSGIPTSNGLPSGFLDNFCSKRPHVSSSQQTPGQQNLNSQSEVISNGKGTHSKEGVRIVPSNDVSNSTTTGTTSLRNCDLTSNITNTTAPGISKLTQQQQSTCNGGLESKDVNSVNGMQANSQCSDPDCDVGPEDSVDDSCSEQSSSTSASNQKDNKHCDCCYCEVFGHGTPTVAPVSKNYIEMRERLRLRLTKRKSKCKNSVNTSTTAPQIPPVAVPVCPTQKEKVKESLPTQDVDLLVSFINGTGGGTEKAANNGKSALNSKAAKRARQKQRKAEEKAKKQHDKPKADAIEKPTKTDTETSPAKPVLTSTDNANPRVISLESIMEEMRKGDMAGKGTKDSILKKVIEAVKAGDSSNNCTQTPSTVKTESKATKPTVNKTSPSKWSVSLQSLVAAAGQAGLEIVPIPTPSHDSTKSKETNQEVIVNKEIKEEQKVAAKSNKKKKSKGNETEKNQLNKKSSSIIAAPVSNKTEEIKQQPTVIITKGGKSDGLEFLSKLSLPSQLPSGVSISCITTKDAKTNKKPEVDIISIKSEVSTETKKANATQSKTVSVRIIEANPLGVPAATVQDQPGSKQTNTNKKKKSKPVSSSIGPQVQITSAASLLQTKNKPNTAAASTIQATGQPRANDSAVTVISISSPSPFSNKKVTPTVNIQKSKEPLTNGSDATEQTTATKHGKLKIKKEDIKIEDFIKLPVNMDCEVKPKNLNGIRGNIIENSKISPTNESAAQTSNKNIASSTQVSVRTKKNKKKKGSGDDLKSIDEVFVPRDIDLDNGELDESERELEAFKRFCWNSIPLANKEKVHVNLKDIVIKKKSVLSCS